MPLIGFIFNGLTQSSIHKILRLSLQGILIVSIICLIVPFSPMMPASGIDQSWLLGINQAMSQGMAFGTDVVFTYGPYASIYTRNYHPAIDHLMFFGSLYFGVSYALALFLLVRKSNWLLIATFWLFLIGVTAISESLFLSYPLLVGILYFREDSLFLKAQNNNYLKISILAILFSPFGLLPLIKGSFLLISGIVTIIIATMCILKSKWVNLLVVILAPVFSAMIFWWLSEQETNNFLFYFKSLFPIISGYTEAMATDGDMNEIYAYIFACFFLLGSILLGGSNFSKRKVCIFFIFCAYLFVAFKGGFVRHDGHEVIAGLAIMIASFFFAFTFGSLQAFVVLAVSLGAWLHIDQVNANTSIASVPNRLQFFYVSAWDGLRDRLAGNEKFELKFNDAINKLRDQARFPLLKGTTDIYSYNQSLLIASGNTWNPRPIFQSYSAYTPDLLKKNRDHLLKRNAPDNIIFRVEPIDERMPSIEDGASWPTLLSRYEIFDRSNDFLYLRRKADKLNANNQVIIGGGTYFFGEAVSVPTQAAPVFVEILIKPSILGKLAALLYKPSRLSITMSLENGSTKIYRLVSGMASAGFIVSPLIENTDEFGLLYAGASNLDHKAVRFFSISALNNEFEWNTSYKVTFYSVELNPH
jgi:hypothetical protein